MRIAWRPIEPPLEPVAAVGRGVVGDRLAERASRRGDWRVIRYAQWTLIAGDDLPWVDGVVYLGVLPGTKDVLVPVHRRPHLHADLVVNAVRSLTVGRTGVAIVPDEEQVAVLVVGAE
jgi:hypothetical protein